MGLGLFICETSAPQALTSDVAALLIRAAQASPATVVGKQVQKRCSLFI